MVSMDRIEYEHLEFKVKEGRRFKERYERGLRAMREQENEVYALKVRMKYLEDMVREQKESQDELKRLKSVEEKMIKKDMDALMETVRRNAELDEEEGHRGKKRKKYSHESPEQALELGDIKGYYHLQCEKAARENKPEEVMRYSKLMEEYSKTMGTLVYLMNGGGLITTSGRAWQKRLNARIKDVPNYSNSPRPTAEEVTNYMDQWNDVLRQHAGRWNRTNKRYE